MEINFYLEDGKVNMYVTDALLKPRVKYYTGKKVTEWNKEKQKASGHYQEDVNNRIRTLRSYATTAWNKLERSESITSDNLYNEICLLDGRADKLRLVDSDMVKEYDRYVKLAKDGENGIKRKTLSGKEYSKGTISCMSSVKTSLVKFEKETGYKLSWRNINDTFYEKYTNYLWDVAGNHDLVVGLKVAYLKNFMDWCVDEKILSRVLYSNKWKVWLEPDADSICLMPDEIKLLYNMPLNEGDYYHGVALTKESVEQYDKLRKRYVFGCLTLLRPGDLAVLSETDLIIQGNTWHINPIQDKTDKPVCVKLHDIAIEIIKEYRHKHTTLLPPMLVKEYLCGLKELALIFRDYLNTLNLDGKITNNWNAPFTRTRYKRGKPYREQIDICDMFRPHTQRASGATTLLILGMREYEVKKIGGWSKNSRSFGKYVRMAQQYIDAQSTSAWDQIFEKKLKVS